MTEGIVNRWILRSRGSAWSIGEQYMSYILEESTSTSLLESSEDVVRGFPIIGDLVVVKCDLQFTGAGDIKFINKFCGALPNGIMEKLRYDYIGGDGRFEILKGPYPYLTIRVWEEPEALLLLTTEDYERSQGETKTWNLNDNDGYRTIDCILSHEHRKMTVVKFFSLIFRENEIITGIPDIYEIRREYEWYMGGLEIGLIRHIKLPIIGVVGTLLDSKVLRHDVTKRGEYIGGEGSETVFHKILFRGRRPMWVDSMIWRCPSALSLPIYLPLS